MNKYISKALIYDRRVDIISLTASTFLIYAINFAVFFSNIFYNDYYDYYALLKLGAFLPSTFIISFAISLYSNKDVKYFHFLTEPQKRDRVAITNLLIPILSFAFSLSLYGIIATVIFLSKGNSLSTIGVLWSKIIFILALLMLINSLIQFFQMLFGNYIAGFLIPLFFAFGTPISALFLSNLISDKIPFLKNLLAFVKDIFGVIFISLFKTIGFINDSTTSSITYSPNNISNINVSLTIAFFSLSLILMLLTIKLNKRLKLENITKIFMFKWMEKIFLVLTSFVALSFITVVVTIIFPIIDLNNQNLLLIVDICLIPLLILVYKIISKVWHKAAC